jgi:hypothetical protein
MGTTARPIIIPDDFWSRADVHAALLNHDFRTLFDLINKKTGASQVRIGVAVQMSQTEVSEIIRGKSQVSYFVVYQRIADGLGMPDHARRTLGLAANDPPLDQPPAPRSPTTPQAAAITHIIPAHGTHQAVSPAKPVPMPHRAPSRGPLVPDEFWQRPDVVGALADQDVGTVFYLLNRKYGISQTKLSNVVGMSQGQLSGILHHKTYVTARHVYERIANGLEMPNNAREAFGLAAGTVTSPSNPPAVTPALAGRYDSDDGTGDLLAGAAEPSRRASALPASQDPGYQRLVEVLMALMGNHNRRELLHWLAGSAVFAASTPTTTAPHDLEQLRRTLLVAAAGDVGTADLERIVWDRAWSFNTTPPESMFDILADDMIIVQRLYDRLRSDTDRRHLNGVTAQLSSLLAETLAALGNISGSRIWYSTARRLADESCEPDVRTWVRSREIVQGLYEQRPPQHLLALADETIEISDKPSAGAVHARVGRAQVLAALGRSTDAINAIRDAEEMFSGLPSSVTSDAVSVFGFAEHRLRHSEGYVYTHLAQVALAETALTSAAAIYPPEAIVARVHLDLLTSLRLIHDRDPRGGLDYAVTILQRVHDGHLTEHIRVPVKSLVESVPTSERHYQGLIELRELAAIQ